MKISIRNFQSIKNADIDIEGVTIITGKTNGGKTAIIRAIDEAVFNNGDDSHVRAGTDESSVSIEDAGHMFEYRRSAKRKSEKTSYSFDGGDEIRKVGRDQLPEVVDMLHISDVKMANGSHALLNFWHQNDRPFLMDKSPQQLYEFLSLSSAKTYTDVLKRMKKDAKDLRTEVIGESRVIEDNRKQLAGKNAYLRSQEGFDRLYDEIAELDGNDRRNAESCRKADECMGIENIIKEKRRKAESITLLPDIDVASLIAGEKANREASARMDEADQAGRSAEDRRKRLESLAILPDISIEGILNSEKRTSDAERRILEAEAIGRRCNEAKRKLGAVIIMPDISISEIAEKEQKTRQHILSLKECASAAERYRNAGKRLASAQPLPDIAIEGIMKAESALAEKERLMREVESLERDVSEKKKRLNAASIEAERAEAELKRCEKEIGVCPLCGRAFASHGQQ